MAIDKHSTHEPNGLINIYIYIYSEMVDCDDESDKMMKISGKMDKSYTYKGFSSNISFFI